MKSAGISTGTGESLPEGLVLRAVRSEVDVERWAAFNATCNNPQEGATCDCLLRHHPGTTLDDYWLIEDRRTGEIVSTTCLLPWTGRFAGFELKIAQLEMVLTHPQYRHQGLIRAQMAHFARTVQERGYDLSLIWGIPYYYRQYGYAYAIDGEMAESLPAWKIPGPGSGSASPCRLSPASPGGAPRLAALYERMAAPLDFAIQRTEAYWQYLLEAAKWPVEMVDDARTGETLGYVVVRRSAGMVTIQEHSLAGAGEALAILQLLKEREQCGEIRIAWPQETPMVQLARSLGSQAVPGGQWLIRITDVHSFLEKLRPILERRVRHSAWQGLTRDLVINLYRQAYRLEFRGGRLAEAVELGFVDSSMGADGGDLCIPPEAFVRLVCGYRRLEELRDAWPDTAVKAEARAVIEVLFPPLKGYLCAPYHYVGEID